MRNAKQVTLTDEQINALIELANEKSEELANFDDATEEQNKLLESIVNALEAAQ